MRDVAQQILDDNGFRSRKFVALIAYWVMVTAAVCGAIHFPTLKDLFVSYWTGLSAGLAAYFGVQFGHSYLAAGVGNTPAVPPQDPADGSAKVPDDA